MIALIVDGIISVEKLTPVESKNLENNSFINFEENIISGTAELNNKERVLILSDKKLLNQVTYYLHCYYTFRRHE